MLFPEHEWPPLIDPDGYRARVATGRERASRSSVLFCGMGRDVIGRQSQSWVRFPDLGWKVVSAHVSTIEGPRLR